jgi:acyl dehydratase
VTLWYEDVVLEQVHELGSHHFTEAEIIRFARAYDPQYFHIDPEAAVHSHFGGLIACGWHTAAVGHRKMVDALEAQEQRLRAEGLKPGVSGPSPGGSKLSFSVPVRPGDTISYRLSVYNKRHSNSIAGWGLLFNRMVATNQRGEQVYLSEFVGFSKRRDYRMPWRRKLLQAVTEIPVIGTWLKRRS